jgi:hypothetical protein
MKPALLLTTLMLLLAPPDLAVHRAPALAVAPSASPATRPVLSDSLLLDEVQRRTFRYFWDFAHPVSGLARERSNTTEEYGNEVVTIGGSGFGVMAIVVAAERGWITREQARDRLLGSTAFLMRADRFHGVFPHWMNGATGKVVPFSADDDGGDIVETAYLFEGLLTARQYFGRTDPPEAELRARIDTLWRAVEWSWHVKPGGSALWWNWSPRHGYAVDAQVAGWNEALITYVLAASSPTHPIDAATYHHGWARDGAIRNGRSYDGIVLPLGPAYGGPLFFEHYSFVGLDPRGLSDRYADYWQQCVNHTLINRGYCVRNPRRFKGYGPLAWGLTASDERHGYSAHSPTDDNGTLTPSAALASFPFTPAYSMQALRHFHDDLGGRLWGEYGFVDAFNETAGWTASSYIAIDQGPIIVMIENHRSGLPWRLFMSCPEVKQGLKRLGFTSPHLR